MSGITKQQQADLAVDAYNSRTVTKQWEKPINIGGHDYKVLAVRNNPKTGYHGTVYQDVRTNEIVVAHRGTESPLTDWRDAHTDFNMAVRNLNLQATDSEALTRIGIEEAKRFHQNHPDLPTPKISHVGHSLGGAHVEIQAYRFGHEGATFNGYGAIGMHGVKGSGNVTNYVKASDVVSAASRHYGRVVVLATEEDLEPLRRYGYNNQRNNYATRAFGAALSAVGSAHSSQNFVGKDSILSDRNYDRARRLADENRFMIQDFRGDVEFNRNILSAVFQAGELAVEVQKASAKSKITPKKPWDFKDRTTDTIQEQIKDIIKSVPTPKSLFDSRSLHLMQNDNMRPDVEKELYAGAGRPNISKPLTKNASADEFREYGFAALLSDDDDKMHAALDSLLDSDIGRSLRQNADKVYAAQEREQEMVRLAEEQARQVDVPVMQMGRG